jgi:spermidine synthase
VLVLFGLTLFVSAFLLFWVQLMVAKMMLPLLGGSPSVWNTCLFFFQATLLLGYSYTYLISRRLKPKQQIWLHGLVLLLPLPLLPIAFHRLPPVEANPIPWLLGLLGVGVGLPFFVVATSAPLIQQWFAQTNHPESADPYFLYSASNAGSMMGLLSYPLLIEPNFTLSVQSWGWAIAYALLGLLTLACGVYLWRSSPEKLPALPTTKLTAQPPTCLQQSGWVLLSFLPSSLLLGTTTYLTTDIAAIPLLWAVPLAIYLLTFILTFARRPPLQPQRLVDLLPLIITPLVILLLLKVTQPTVIVLPLHLLGLLMVAYVLHGYLAASRPHPQYLTRFYLLISLGGVLGGLLNAIAAPLLFSTVLEYPLVLILSLLLLPSLPVPQTSRLRTTFPLAVGLLLGALLIGWSLQNWQQNLLADGLMLGLLGAIACGFSFKPLRFGVGCILILLLGQFSLTSLGGVLTNDRSFFGVYQVLEDQVGKYNTLLHGTTVHGRQSFDPSRQQAPLTYFTRSGPIGQVLATNSHQQVAVLGLGVGTLATYAKPGQTWDFYEIDPLVVKLAQDQRYFTFLANSAVTPNVVVGDARLRLAASTHPYDLIVMDAFNSDAIPVHLITREAMQLYLHQLTKRGLIVVNITNRYLNLEPVLASLAKDLELFGIKRDDRDLSELEIAAGKSASRWVVLAQHPQDLAFLSQDQRWQAITPATKVPVWTDNYSNLIQVWRND